MGKTVSLQDYPPGSAARLLWCLYLDIQNFNPNVKGTLLQRTFILGPWASAFFDLHPTPTKTAGTLGVSGHAFYQLCAELAWERNLVLLRRADGSLQNAFYLPFVIPKEGTMPAITLALRVRLRPGRAEQLAAALPERTLINALCVGVDGAPEALQEGGSNLHQFTLKVLDRLPWEDE